MALFRSPHKGFVQNVRPSTAKYHPVTGVEIDRVPALAANFGVFGPAYTIVSPETGETVEVADIYGGFFDSRAAQEQNGWTDDERETVETVLRNVAKKTPMYVQEITPEHVPATAPWVTYDDATDLKAIVEVARMTGMVPETIRYERENLNRAALLQPLLEVLGEMDPDAQKRAEAVEEIPAGALDDEMPKLRVGKGIRTTESGVAADTSGLVLTAGTIIIE